MQKARRPPKGSTACRHTVSGSFSLPCSGFFSPFLHSTGSLSVTEEYLALPDGSGCFPQNFTCSAVLRIPLLSSGFYLQGFHLLWPHVPVCSAIHTIRSCGPTTPTPYDAGLGSSRFARHYSGNHVCFLFLRVLRCFTSPGLLPLLGDRA